MDNRQTYLCRAARSRRLRLLAPLIAVTVLAGAAAAAPGLTELVSVRSNGKQGDGISGRTAGPSLSADGLVVAFDSSATNLVGGDNNGAIDVFVRDRARGRTTRVSVDSKGKQADAFSVGPALSADGRFVAFESAATNLVPGDTNGAHDVFVHDRVTAETTRVSVAADGTQGDNHSIGPVSISADGRFVAFASDATNLVPHAGAIRQAYVKDRTTGAIELVSVDSAGNPAQGFVAPPTISGDGRFVAVVSSAANLVPDDTNGQVDVFVHDRTTGSTMRVSVDSAGGQANGNSFHPDLSGDGRFVAFDSEASNLVPGDTNGVRDVFVHDLLSGATVRASVDSAGAEANGLSPSNGIRGGLIGGARITDDGRFVAFDSSATNLVADDTNTCGPFYTSPAGACPDVFVHDLVTGQTVRVSVDSAGAQANSASTDPDLSADATTAFFSAASNLVAEDTNGFPDIFVHVG